MKFFINETEFNYCMDLSDKISIKSSNKDYDVLYSSKDLNELIHEIYEENDFIFIDRNVYNLDQLTFNKFINNIFIFDATENNKNIENVLILIDILLNKKFTKKNKLIIIGGGITQEVGGFASAIYKRGLNWILIPTTILSMTDSCIGSKVSINRNSKNMLGLFVAPNKIYISDYFLNSLKNDDIISGIGEALKLSLIGGYESFNYFKENSITN
jgi:3-dehydroquinate synthetase